MFTRILFYDDEGDLMVDYAYSVYIGHDDRVGKGVRIDISEKCGIFIKCDDPDSLIRAIWSSDTYDLTRYGSLVWVDEFGIWGYPSKELNPELYATMNKEG